MSKNQEQIERIYSYLKERQEQKQGCPSHQEIATYCKLSPVTVRRCLSMLEAQGHISRQALKSRSIRVLDEGEEAPPPENEVAGAVYEYLQKEIGAGNIPTQREIAEACYLSRAEVRHALIWLEAQKRIELVQGQRNIRLPE